MTLPVNVPWLEVLVGIMIGITIVTGAIGVLQTYITNRVGQRVMEELRNSLYEHLQGMSLRFFTGTRTGEIQSRLTNDVGGIQSVVTDTATSLLSNIVTLLSTLVAMVILSWQLTVLSLAITPLFVFYTYRAGRVRRQITMQAQESKAEMSAITAGDALGFGDPARPRSSAAVRRRSTASARRTIASRTSPSARR